MTLEAASEEEVTFYLISPIKAHEMEVKPLFWKTSLITLFADVKAEFREH